MDLIIKRLYEAELAYMLLCADLEIPRAASPGGVGCRKHWHMVIKGTDGETKVIRGLSFSPYFALFTGAGQGLLLPDLEVLCGREERKPDTIFIFNR